MANYTVRGIGVCGKLKTTYQSWSDMKKRCNNPAQKDYHNYGEKGITYEAAWENFENFLRDMGEKPLGLTLDRIDSTKNYSKDNCRWATRLEQARNKGRYRNCPLGITGVYINQSNIKGKLYQYFQVLTNTGDRLYHGKDFFEACCVRRSWENNLQNIPKGEEE